MSSPQRPAQTVEAVDGYAYGAIGADIHVFGDGVPLYLLHEFRRSEAPDRRWLRELPSRMLNARFALVRFTGRATEMAELIAWLSEGPGLSARWLHGPGGQGKSRLAAELCAMAAEQGWKVVTAVHGPGSVLPAAGSQDLSAAGTAGVLLVVDYADRWPLGHLTWLLSNTLLHHPGPTRIMLLGRSAVMWPAVRTILADFQADAAEQRLGQAPDRAAREAMFAAAYADFLRLYDLTGHVPAAPALVDDPQMGLTLTLHMAALVSVDALSRRRRPPASPAELTLYLLDREHAYWAQMFAEPAHLIGARSYNTTPEAMNRTVFAAALSGRRSPDSGLALVRSLALPGDPGEVLRDHAAAYPCLDGAGTLEPLYPDRLAEDFLALTFPGHRVEYPSRQWADPTARKLASRDAAGQAPDYLDRYFFFLGAAAQDGRWRHVRPFLNGLLSQDPQLAVDAGGPALLGLTDTLSNDTLAAIYPLVPDAEQDLDFAVSGAELAVRLTPIRLRAAADGIERGQIYSDLSRRLSQAGRWDDALAASRNSQASYARGGIDALGLPGRRLLAVELTAFAGISLKCGHFQEGLDAARRAVATFREGVEAAPDASLGPLAPSLLNLAHLLEANGHTDDAIEVNREAVTVYREIARRDPEGHDPGLSSALTELAVKLCDTGNVEQAAREAEQAYEIAERVTRSGRSGHQEVLAEALAALGQARLVARRRPEGVDLLGQALQIYQRLADQQPGIFDINVCGVLWLLAEAALENGDASEAVGLAGLRLEILERLARSRPVVYGRDLEEARVFAGDVLARAGEYVAAHQLVSEAVGGLRARARHAKDQPASSSLANALTVLSRILKLQGEPDQANRTQAQAVELYRRLWQESPGAYGDAFAGALHDLGIRTIESGSLNAGADLVLESLHRYEDMAGAWPGRYELQVASALRSAAKVNMERGDWERAREMLSRSNTLFGRLHRRDPDHFGLIDAMADNVYTLARLQYQDGLYADAVASSGEATTMLQTALSRGAASRGKVAERLAIFGNIAAMSNVKLGRATEAQRSIEDVVRTLRGLTETEPGSVYLLAGFLVNAGLVFRRTGKPDQADSLFREGIDIYRFLTRRDRAAFGPHLARSLHVYATADVAPGSTPTKSQIAAAEESVSQYEWLTKRVSSEYVADLARSLRGAADLYEEAGMLRRARRARDALERL